MRNYRELRLEKSGELYIFRYGDGDEADTLESIAEFAVDPEYNFDWLDAAYLSMKMNGYDSAAGLIQMIKPDEEIGDGGIEGRINPRD